MIISLFSINAYAAVDNTYKNSNGEAFLKGSYLQVGIALNGRFGTSNTVPSGKGFFPSPRGSGKSYARGNLGFIADRNRDGGWIDGDFFLPGTPYEGWYVDVAGTTGKFDNANGTSGNVGTLSDIEITSSSASVTHTVTINEVVISQRYSVPIGSGTFDGDQQLSIRVTISNPTGGAKSGIYYARQVDPDNNVDTGGNYDTENQVEAKYGVSGSAYSLVSAVSAAAGVSGNSYLGLFSSDSRSSPARNSSGFSAPASARAIYDGSGLITTVENSRTRRDAGISMGFNLGTLNAGSSTTFDFAYVLSSTAATQAVAAASAPAAPTGTPENQQVVLSWTQPTSADPIVGYRIFRSTDGTNFDSGTDEISTSLTKTITGLTNGTSYYFKVAALTGTAPYTVGTASGVSAAIIPRTVPGAPTSVTPTRQNSQVSLSWTAPASNGGSGITDYKIEYKAGSGDWVEFVRSPSTATTVTVTGLSNGTAYVFRVTAKNVAGFGSTSTESAAATPVPPVAITLTVNQNSITAGQTVTATVTTYISDGVVYSDYGGSSPTINVASDSQATSATPSAWSSGVSTVVVTLKTAGTHSLSTTISGISATAGPVTVAVGTLNKINISIGTSLTQNQVTTATLTAQDEFGNTVTTYSPNTPVLSSTGNQAQFGTLSSWVNGVATVTVTYPNAGSRNFIYTDGAISRTVNITVGVPTNPVVTSISPSSATTDGGVSATITGSQLTGTTGVTFGGVAATNIVVVSDTEVTLTVPAGIEGVVTIVLTTTTGSDTNAVQFTYNPNAATVAARARAAAAAAAAAEAARREAANRELASRISVTPIEVTPGQGTQKFTVNGSNSFTAIISPEAKPNHPNVSEIKIAGNSFEVITVNTFSGKTTVPVTITENGAVTTINVDLVVNPKPVEGAKSLPISGRLSNVEWGISPNAISYSVKINGVEVCRTTENVCSVPRIIGPKTQVTVVTLGNDGTVSEERLPVFISEKPVPVSTLKIPNTTSALSRKETRRLNAIVDLVKSEGFTSVAISVPGQSGITAGARRAFNSKSSDVAKYLLQFVNLELDPVEFKQRSKLSPRTKDSLVAGVKISVIYRP